MKFAHKLCEECKGFCFYNAVIFNPPEKCDELVNQQRLTVKS